MLIVNFIVTTAVFMLSDLNLVQSYSTYTITATTMKNSHSILLDVDSASRQSSSDTTEYKLTLNTCTFTSNAYNNYDLYTFSNVATSQMDFENVGCLSAGALPTCTATGQYYDTILKECTGNYQLI